MGDNRSVLSLSEEQSSFSSKSLSTKKKGIPDGEEEERGSNSESIKEPQLPEEKINEIAKSELIPSSKENLVEPKTELRNAE